MGGFDTVFRDLRVPISPKLEQLAECLQNVIPPDSPGPRCLRLRHRIDFGKFGCLILTHEGLIFPEEPPEIVLPAMVPGGDHWTAVCK
ncbi:uncharacterized protein LDX57_008912 [Aspergillus melleus]|uniref:uncharacterized protein n=1 Tax=Aspergillus melleus TaxID=138277 RepID=UPI001E8CB33C|nr:uncharacterized protein LDX57_008912 [Aspergillus melleus]KAH8431250.1 hypothetical protein LDX57_008912 [Aspergillus melleus]